MPRGLDSADRKLLIGAGVFFAALVVAAAVVSPPQFSGSSADPSSYSPTWNGAEGAYLMLQQLGYDVSRWESSPTELPADSTGYVLILADPDPTQTPSEEERFALIEFVENGGRVIATGAAASALLPERSDFQEGDPLEPPKMFAALAPSPIVRGAPQITMTPPSNWSFRSVRQIALYGDESTAAVITYQFGKGEVIWWAAPTPLTNGAILNSANLNFFLNCVGPPGHGHVFWDEYFHGVRGSLLNFFERTPVLWGALQFGLVFLAIAATYSRRLGPVRSPVTPSRLSPLEFVDTLGDLYASAHVAPTAVAIACQRFRFMLTRKLGLPIDIRSKELASIASESFGWEEALLLETLEQCDSAAQAGRKDIEALELVQQMHDYSARLEIKHSNVKEREME
jgi:hypothetical protein